MPKQSDWIPSSSDVEFRAAPPSIKPPRLFLSDLPASDHRTAVSGEAARAHRHRAPRDGVQQDQLRPEVTRTSRSRIGHRSIGLATILVSV